MNKIGQQVLEFHRTFEHPIGKEILSFTRARGRQRLGYLQEEVNELEEAVENGDLVEQVDASLDAIYFAVGNLVELGVIDKFQDLFDEVQASNMSKACKTEKEAIDTINKYTKEGIQTFHKKVKGYWIVYRVDNLKIVKSINYFKPNLRKILNIK